MAHPEEKHEFPIIKVDDIHYTTSQVVDLIRAAVATAKKAGTAKTIYRLKRDLVIPSGTEFGTTLPGETRRYASPHATLDIPISKDATASLTMDLDDAIDNELIERRMVL